MRDTVIVEKMQKPVVAAVTQQFVAHGVNIARMEKHPGLKQLVFPYPLEGLPKETLTEIADALYPKFLDMIGASR